MLRDYTIHQRLDIGRGILVKSQSILRADSVRKPPPRALICSRFSTADKHMSAQDHYNSASRNRLRRESIVVVKTSEDRPSNEPYRTGAGIQRRHRVPLPGPHFGMPSIA